MWDTLPPQQIVFSSHARNTNIETDHSPLTTDTATADALTSHDCITNPTATEVLATTEDMHPVPHPTTAAVCTTL